jgi:hypothetical protein
MLKPQYAGYDVDYDAIIGCWCLHYDGEIICLGNDLYDDALAEAANIVDDWGN